MSPWIQELRFPRLTIPVTVDRMLPVLPAGSVPSQPLYLSNLDNMIGSRVFTPTVYFYPRGPTAKPPIVETLCNSLSSILVPYYPFSGRLRETESGKLEVFFGEDRGALLVEAHSPLALADLGDLTVPNPDWKPLIFRFPNEEPFQLLRMPLVMAQVTLFSCGGFSIGLRVCHCLCDGLGAMQFIRAWAETTRAEKVVTDPEPCWDREFFKPREPPLVTFPHIEFAKIEDHSSLAASLSQSPPVQKCYKINNEFQSHLKTTMNIGEIPFVSTFDAMAAHIWRSWIKALDVKPPETDLRLSFSINIRPKMKNPPLPEGFYGNALCVACATSNARDLTQGTLSDAARLVGEARGRMTEEYVRSTVDRVEVDMPRRMEFGGKLSMTQWTRFFLYECGDFGWGKPVYVGPIDLTPMPQVCVLLPDGGEADSGGSGGGMLVLLCLPELVADEFIKYFGLNESDS